MKQFRFTCLFLILVSTVMLAKSNPVPLINQPLVPTSVAPGSGGFTLTVNGVGFASGALVYWNGSVRSTSFISGHQLQAQISAGDVATVNTALITVQNPIPGGGVSNVVYFQIRNPVLGFGFRNGIEFPGLNLHNSPVVGDFNGDGKLDIAALVVGSDSSLIEVFPGNGDGTFGSPITTERKNWQLSGLMVIGDFNGDGKLDLAIPERLLHRGSVNIGIFLGKGDGTFIHTKAQAIPTKYIPTMAVDKNGDGKLDLYTNGGIYKGNGDGTFNPPSGKARRNSGAAFGDFDGDGKIDQATLGVGEFYIEVSTSRGKRGRYQIPNASGVAAIDINGDGKLDLITDRLSVLLGNGDGTFQQASGGLSGAGGSVGFGDFSGAVGFGDFNGDGKLDAVVGQNVFLGNGDGTFQSPLVFPNSMFGIGDFSGDGKLDVITTDPMTGTLSLVLQSRVYLSPTQLAFAAQQIHTTSPPQTVTVTNFGTLTPLVITQVNFTGPNAADFAQTNNCGSPIPPEGTCQIQVTFTPSLVGGESAMLNVTSEGSGTVSILVYGGGVDNQSYTVTLTPPSLTYPNQVIGTTSAPQTATLTNTGNQPITISSIAATVPFSQTNNCPSTLPVNSNCQIQVVFTPTKLGPAKGMLSVTDNAVGSPQTVALSGTGVSAVEFSPASVDFGNQNVGTTSVPIPITLTNIGPNTLSITQIAIKGSNAGDFAQTNDCGNSVPPGGHCTITVTFTPTVKGQRSAKVSVSDDAVGSPQTVPLSGTGT
jgi:hypothetical protein